LEAQGDSVGLTHIDVDIANPAKPRRTLRLTLLVDSGAVYSVVPASLLRKLGVKPHSRRSFILADGTKITRRVGDLLFRLNGQQGTSPVIFGQKDDSVLLGSVSLEALGLMLDPLKRQLRPLPMLLASLLPSPSR
jgi:clan AA aspartic protease